MLPSRTKRLALAVAAASVWACGDDGSQAETGSAGTADTGGADGFECVPHTDLFCSCDDGRTGTRLCLASGFEAGPCVCGAAGTTAGSTTVGPGTDSGADSTTGGPACGDGMLDDMEACDDGNIDGGDECRADCTLPVEELWTVTHDGPVSQRDTGTAVLPADDGTYYVLGTETNDVGMADVWLRHMNTDGTELWTRVYDGSAGSNDRAGDIVWHTSGDLLVVGEMTVDAAQGTDIFAMRVDATDGEPAWLQTFDGDGPENDDDDFASGAAVDADGNIYVLGHVRTSAQLGDIWLRKYDESGGELWTTTVNGGNDRSDFGNDVVVDAEGNVYAGGNTNEPNAGRDAWLRKYDPDGAEIWTQTHGDGALDQSISALAIDGAGDIVAGGIAQGEGSGLDAWLRKYDLDGTEVWTQTYDWGTGDDTIAGVSIGPNDSILVAGSIGVGGESANVWLRKYDSTGVARWSASHDNAEASLADFGSDVAVDADGDIVVVGSETVSGQDRNIWIRKYREAP